VWILLLLSFGVGAQEGPVVIHDVMVASKEICEQARDRILSRSPAKAGMQVYCVPRSLHYKWETEMPPKPK
jgi:hypothetical protein